MADEHSLIAHSGGNETSGDETEPGFYARYDVFPIVLCALIVVANSTVVVLVSCRAKMWTATNGVLASLAVSDLSSGLIGVPLYIVCTRTYEARWCEASVIVWRFLSISTVLHLTLVSLDRYVSIVHVMRYKTIVTRRLVLALLSIAWVCSAFVSVIQLSWVKRVQAGSEDEEREFRRQTIIYNITVLILFLGLPLATMIYSYTRILVCVGHYRSKKYASVQSDPTGKNDELFDNVMARWKTALVFAAMIFAFLFLWGPYFAFELLENYVELDSLPSWVWYVLFYYTRFTASFVNPLLYLTGKRDFREALCECLHCKRNANETTANGDTMNSLV